MEQILDEPELAVAADERRLEARRAHRAAAPRDDAQRTPELDRLGLALELVLAGVLVGDRASVARLVASPTSTVPGSAADWIREAVLTRSPATMPWPVAPERDRCLAGEHACPRAAGVGSSSRDRRDEVERGTHGALRVVLLRDRRAPDRHHGVADELLDRAAVPLDHRARATSK